MSSERLAAVILAAGFSSRMDGVKKEFLKLTDDDDLTVLGSAVRVFASIQSVKTIVIAVPENEEEAGRRALPPELLSEHDPCIIFITGGKTRSGSVLNALSALVSHNPGYVLIHDGARPWVSVSLVNNIVAAVKKYDAVIPLLPLTDTPKEISKNNEQRTDDKEQKIGSKEQPVLFIKRHLKRINVGLAQTPQAFKFPEILHAHEKAAGFSDEEFTDDAEIWGRFRGDVAVIPGEKENRKITYKEDIY